MIPAMKAVWEQNNDFAGWLRIRDTIIDYPVMFRPDDWGFYVRRNFVGEDDNAGTLFIDENNTLDPRSTNLIIYGHDMRNGTMFGSLIKYTDKDFFLQHPIIEFTTLYERNEYEIVSVFKSRIFYRHERNVFRFYQFYNAETEEEFNEFVENMQKIQLFDTGITPEFGDKLIMLLTCERSQENGRLAVVARRVRDENAR
jgi:sortase B